MTKLEEFVRQAVQPTVRDVLEARAEILETLARVGTANRESFAGALLERRGLAPAAAHDERMQVTRDGRGNQTVAADDAAIVRQRTDFAVREALGQLAAEGIVLQAAGSYYGPQSVNVPAEEKGSWGGGITVQDSAPTWGGDGWNSRWRLTRPAGHPSQQLARAALTDGLGDLLQPRGLIVLEEAIRCFHRGLFVAAVDLLAAASEAAWFTVGAAVQDDAELTRLVGQGQNVADVIHRTGEGISRVGALHRQVLRDLRAQAARFRDLRNYGLHPLGPQQQEHEEAFSEAGAALLFMTARSYFQRLRSALEALRSGAS